MKMALGGVGCATLSRDKIWRYQKTAADTLIPTPSSCEPFLEWSCRTPHHQALAHEVPPVALCRNTRARKLSPRVLGETILRESIASWLSHDVVQTAVPRGLRWKHPIRYAAR